MYPAPAVSLMAQGRISFSFNATGSTLFALACLSATGVGSGVKKARGVSCCVVSYVYLAAVATVVLAAVAFAIATNKSVLEVRSWVSGVVVSRAPRACL